MKSFFSFLHIKVINVESTPPENAIPTFVLVLLSIDFINKEDSFGIICFLFGNNLQNLYENRDDLK